VNGKKKEDAYLAERSMEAEEEEDASLAR